MTTYKGSYADSKSKKAHARTRHLAVGFRSEPSEIPWAPIESPNEFLRSGYKNIRALQSQNEIDRSIHNLNIKDDPTHKHLLHHREEICKKPKSWKHNKKYRRQWMKNTNDTQKGLRQKSINTAKEIDQFLRHTVFETIGISTEQLIHDANQGNITAFEQLYKDEIN